MQSKRKLIMWLLAAAFLTGLLTIMLYVKLLDCEDLLLVTPTSSNSSEVSAEALEEINGDEFLLTYEILSQESIQALNANYDVTIMKTNYAYPFIMHEKLLKGSFFTVQDQKEKKQAAVLNQTAACAMFGNTEICGSYVIIGQDKFTVIGVIDDKSDEESNVYIPAACSGENPRSFAVQMEDDLTGKQVENECKSLAAPENGYRFISFGTLADLVCGLFFIGVKLVVIGILLFVLKKSYNMLGKIIKDIRYLSERVYLKALLRDHTKEVLQAVSVSTAMILMMILALSLAFSFIDYCLLWSDTISLVQFKDILPRLLYQKIL